MRRLTLPWLTVPVWLLLAATDHAEALAPLRSMARRQHREQLSFAITTPMAEGSSSSSSGHKATPESINQSSQTPPLPKALVAELQRCWTLADVLHRVGRHVSPMNDPDGTISSLVLVRLSKLAVSLDNARLCNEGSSTHGNDPVHTSFELDSKETGFIVANVVHCLISAAAIAASGKHTTAQTNGVSQTRRLSAVADAFVEGTKAYAVYYRLLDRGGRGRQHMSVLELLQCWDRHSYSLANTMVDHQLSGIKWAWDTLQFCIADQCENTVGQPPPFPRALQDAYGALQLDFCILPGGLALKGSSVLFRASGTHRILQDIIQEVDFEMDDIRATASGSIVRERRFTAWQGDDDGSVGPFRYSGKSMPRSDWTDSVLKIRNLLYNATGQYYNACLLNHYPNGQSGMRYHSDPDQGTLWDYDTAVVSIGASRRFSFRHRVESNGDPEANSPQQRSKLKTNQPSRHQPHNFVVMHSDITYMYGTCQERFQHTVKNAEDRDEVSPRISLVFKRTFDTPKQVSLSSSAS